MPIVNATIIEYSLDNSTNWQNVTSLDTTNNEGYQINLLTGEKYYFRAKNSTATEWQYLWQRTESGGHHMEIAIALTLTLFSLAFIIIGIYLFMRNRKNEPDW